MTNKDLNKELIWRYIFLYQCSPYIYEYYIKNHKPGIINEPLEFPLLEDFLLSDEPARYSAFVKDIERKSKKLSLKSNNNKELVFKILNHLFEHLTLTDNNPYKLKTLDEYYKILQYKNNEEQDKSKTLLDNKKHNLISKLKKQTHTSNFTKYIANKKNYHEENSSILSDAEKQGIYLQFHNELPWNKTIKCEKDKLLAYRPPRRRNINKDSFGPCNQEFYLKESEIFINPQEEFSDYYQICPNCGYVVTIPTEILNNEIKDRIETKYHNNSQLFKSMMVHSQLKSIDYRDDVLIKKKTLNN